MLARNTFGVDTRGFCEEIGYNVFLCKEVMDWRVLKTVLIHIYSREIVGSPHLMWCLVKRDWGYASSEVEFRRVLPLGVSIKWFDEKWYGKGIIIVPKWINIFKIYKTLDIITFKIFCILFLRPFMFQNWINILKNIFESKTSLKNACLNFMLLS